MSQIRQTAPGPKITPAPVLRPPRNGNGNGNGHGAARNAASSQETFNQKTIGVLRGLASVSEGHERTARKLQEDLDAQASQLTELKTRQEELHERLKHATNPVYLGKGRVFVKTARGLPLIVRADDLQITTSLISDGYWDLPLTQIFERFIKNDMAYLEIGTHVGYFATLAASLVGHRGSIHAFEANPETFRFLEGNMRLNRCTHIAKLVGQAASNQTGKTTFHVFANNPGGSTLSTLPEQLLEEWRERPMPIEVSCTTLDDYFAGETRQFDFIKMDAEGAEPLIFEGGRNFFQERIKPTTVIALEFNPPAIQGLKREPKVFAQGLFDAGFKLWRIVDGENYQPVTSPADLDAWCITELLLSRSEKLPV
jgi:FkbM family methyltransferase